ncbi:lipid II flippase MurJ [Actinotalea solisilvae]|uniref:lipid II flippase MurJ n=1 Tax=Actinotalea solisilvae TaxID=2072922 RepID=UPI0018F2565F|nr:lipid II flippase MurJ [Actinotalea solisilvae]
MSPAARRALTGIAGAAALIAGITVLSRALGFGRWLAQSYAVGQTATGTAYATANLLPNVLFEVVAGGALAGAVVPLLAGPLSRGTRREVDRIASAMLTWTLVVLVPAAALLALLARPLVSLLIPATDRTGDAVDLAAHLLVVFAPQVVLYGVGIVLTGVLQAQRRFAWPAAAPLASSVVVITSYLVFRSLAVQAVQDPSALPDVAVAWLGWGTTAGVAAMSLPLLVPVLRSGVRLRPTLRFPEGVARRARHLALSGVGGLVAQQLAVLATIRLANDRGDADLGTFNLFQYAQAVYLLPYAVLAVPLATATFPRIAEHHARGDGAATRRLVAGSTRAVVLVGALGAAALAAAAPAVARVFIATDASDDADAIAAMGPTLTLLAPGLVGFALLFHLSRVLFALERGRASVTGVAAGWLTVAGASVLAVLVLAPDGGDGAATLAGLAVGSTAGMTVAGVVLLVLTVRAAGPGAGAGTGRTVAVAGLGAAVGGVLGRVAADAVLATGESVGVALLGGVAGGVVAVLALALAALALDRGTVAALRRRGGTAAPAAPSPPPSAPNARPSPRETRPMADPTPPGPRVLQVLGSSAGGVARHVAEVASGAAGRGTRVAVAGPAALAGQVGRDHVPYVPVEITDRPGPGDVVALRRLRALAASADVVHAHGLRAGALAVLAARGLRGGPEVVVTLHNLPVGGPAIRAVAAALEVVVARGAHTVLGVSGDLVDRARGRGARRTERALVPAPPHRPAATSAAEVRAALGVPDGVALVLTVARLAPQKGLDLLCDAAALLGADHPGGGGALWAVAGDGPLEDGLAGRIAAERLPVRLLGRRADVADLLAAADVVVSAARWEGQPLGVQEALAAGAAVVATDVGGTREVTGDAAELVPPDAAAIGAAVRGLLDDPARRAALGRAALARAATLPTADDTLDQLERVWRDAARGTRPGRGSRDPDVG